jgi:hypothetical protein
VSPSFGLVKSCKITSFLSVEYPPYFSGGLMEISSFFWMKCYPHTSKAISVADHNMIPN